MATFGTEEAAGALEAISEVGQSITLTRSQRVFDPVTETFSDPEPPDDAALSWVGTGVRLTNHKGVKFGGMDDSFKKALITGKALGFLLAADGLERAPEPGDILILADASEWRIVGSTVLNPAGVPILYTLGAISK